MRDLTNRQLRLRRRPAGLPSPEDFELTEKPAPVPGAGQVLVRTLLLFVPGTQPIVGAGTEDSCHRGGVDEPWRYRVDPDAQRTEFDRADLREPDDGGLCRAVHGQQG